MKLESRVEALELELKILKNEIQNTLLEIREQVLNHYYPELRAEEAIQIRPVAPKSGEVRSGKNGQAKSEAGKSNSRLRAESSVPTAFEPQGNVQPFSDIFLDDLDDEDGYDETELSLNYLTARLDAELDDEVEGKFDAELVGDEAHEPPLSAPPSTPGATPKTREVVFNQLKQVPAASQPRTQPATPKSNRRAFAALATWVGNAVAKVGKERAIQVVETYAISGGALTAETKSSILQLISLASDEEPAGSVSNQEMLGLMVELDGLLTDQ